MSQCVLISRSPSPSPGEPTPESSTPASVDVLRVLGQGRAAEAQLVDATMTDGRVLRCVEKVFAPGRLTRAIYRIAFQSPFAYQSNEHAIQSCFYRRRVAAAILAASDLDIEIAAPLYVRFDRQRRAWVLAAQWVDGRGVKPAPAQPHRLRQIFGRLRQTLGRFFGRQPGRSAEPLAVTADSSAAAWGGSQQTTHEIDDLVSQMRQLEKLLIECGLTGSGWQVAPRAMVSTANLLRVAGRYTIIDLESGIPAVLVPKYLFYGLRQAALPPFDDLDPNCLLKWIENNERSMIVRIGPEAVERLRTDVEQLILHSRAWKNSEPAIFRRPWRLLTRAGASAYQNECFRRWRQDEIVDQQTAAALHQQPLKSVLIWWATLLPGRLGRLAGRMIGRASSREKLKRFFVQPAFRKQCLDQYRLQCVQRWRAAQRISQRAQPARFSFAVHSVLGVIAPASVHRFCVDHQRRRHLAVTTCRILFNASYQAQLGEQQIEAAIERWVQQQRISQREANHLRSDLAAQEIAVYARGFGMHLGLKTLAPLIMPAKVGGVAAFIATGNPWFLLPLLLLPCLRLILTIVSWWSSRGRGVPHGEALLTSWLPTVGSAAFPFQMFASRPRLSVFLIRDVASRIGCNLPVYGGANSRTELALIRGCDFLIEIMSWAAGRSQDLRSRFGRRSISPALPEKT